MKEEMKEVTDRFKKATERLRSGESDQEEVELPSGRVRLTLDEASQSGIRIEPLDQEQEGDAAGGLDAEQKERMHRFKEAIERFQADELDSIEVPLPDGGTLRVDRDAEVPGAFIMRTGEDGPTIRSITFESSTTRPTHYPDDLPFIPECDVSLTEMGEGESRTLQWFRPTDPDGQAEELRRQLVEDGWEEGEESRASTSHGVSVWTGYKKGDRTRIVTVNHIGDHVDINLMEAPGPAAEAE